MIIRNFSQRDDGQKFIVEAQVEFEAVSGNQTLFFAVPLAQASWLSIRPDAFLVGTIMAAMWMGEKRLKIEATVDRQLAARLSLAMRLIAHWWGRDIHPLAIEANSFQTPPPVEPVGQTGIFLSGGVDSLSSLIWNTDQYPIGHPKRVTVAFFVYGLDVGDPNKTARHDIFENGQQKLTSICHSLGVELVPIEVNLRSLCPDWQLYATWQFGSLLAAIAHASGNRLRQVIIASDYQLEILAPRGSHPWLNNYYSSDSLSVISGDSEQFTRMQRVHLLSEHPATLDALRVCWMMKEIPIGAVNCGKCEKCLRTRLEILACGGSIKQSAFEGSELTPATLKNLRLADKTVMGYYAELIEPLRTVGRSDLANLVQKKVMNWTLREAIGLNRIRQTFGQIRHNMR